MDGLRARPGHWLRAAALAGGFLSGGLPVTAGAAPAHPVTLAVISQPDDARYAPRLLERAYPGHPHGRPLAAARMAAEEAGVELEVLGLRLKVIELSLADGQALPAALAQLKAAGVRHVLADLPAPALKQLVQLAPAALGGAMVFNIGLEDDALRGDQCAAHLLHTLPSAQMRSDALAQYLAARNWRKLLLLQGPDPQDALQAQALLRSAQRYGLKVVQNRPFKLGTDPRERDLANTRLLTGEREHEVVAVADSVGEFARTLPYATQWPRPVVGSSGLMALAWHPHWERNGGPQLSRRFHKLAGRPMQSHDWAAWAAVKAVAAVLADDPKAGIGQQLKRLRGGGVYLDGAKGPRLSFRPWDGQLRQPMFLAHGDGVAGVAPFEGVLHPTEVLDTLGMDEKESACR
ncbi:MAG: amino acid/amide transporter substrate-binding protein family, partial [Polaromonas sp.]|nr:amino acid/amide transporter substrate-binding protein family [Polaromonas sp.]